MSGALTEPEMVNFIHSRVKEIGSIREAARRWAISKTYLYEVLSGKRHPGLSVLEQIGYERVVSYRKAPHPRATATRTAAAKFRPV